MDTLVIQHMYMAALQIRKLFRASGSYVDFILVTFYIVGQEVLEFQKVEDSALLHIPVKVCVFLVVKEFLQIFDLVFLRHDDHVIEMFCRKLQKHILTEGKLPILIATDVASRGIDVDDVDCVINYDVPEENEYYIHRIGRTGRAKRKGIAVSILGTFPEQTKLAEIAKYSHYSIQPVRFADDGALVEEEVKKSRKAQPRRRFR